VQGEVVGDVVKSNLKLFWRERKANFVASSLC
jgi:hypothetical protein